MSTTAPSPLFPNPPTRHHLFQPSALFISLSQTYPSLPTRVQRGAGLNGVVRGMMRKWPPSVIEALVTYQPHRQTGPPKPRRPLGCPNSFLCHCCRHLALRLRQTGTLTNTNQAKDNGGKGEGLWCPWAEEGPIGSCQVLGT